MKQGSLARRLRVLRAERGLTLREAASRTGVAKETISDIERGLRHPHDPTLAKIAQGYGVPVEDLLEVESPLPLAEALPLPSEPSLRDALPEEWRLSTFEIIRSSAETINNLFAPKVDAGDFTVEEYEQVGETFVRLDFEANAALPTAFSRGGAE